MLVKRLISYNGLSADVLEFSDGQEAFLKLKEMYQMGDPLPEVIFLDVNMPIWDGWDFLDEFSKLQLDSFPDIYIVTSSTHSMEREKALSYPIVKDCIVKPFEMDVLKKILDPDS
jgi:CheY-like chemotaxis protein